MLSIISNFGRGMKRTLFVKIFIALMLLCSMGWGYTVTMTVSSNNGGTASATSTTVSAGNTTTIKATPKTSYRFVNWYVESGSCTISSETSASTTVTVNGDCTVSASFVKTAEVYVGVDPTYSRFEAVVSSYTVDVGRTTNIPSPKVDGYEFYRWYFHSGSEVCEIKDLFASTALVTVNESCNIIAEMRKPVSLSVSATSGGTVHPAEIRKAYSTYPENIEATPKAGYVFDGWIASSGCTVADVKSMKTTVKPGAVAECSVVARFSKEISVKFVNGANGVLRNKDSVVKAGSKITLDFRADKNYQLSHFAYLYGAENCPVEHNDLASEVTVNEDCALQPIYVPYFELTEMEQNYRSYTNGLGGSVNIRYHVAAEDTSWYYIEMSSNLDRTFYLRDYGSDEWTNGPYRECLVAANRTGCYFKSIQNDMYLTASSAIGISTPMGIKYTKVPSSYIDIEYDLAGKRVQFPAISVGLGMDTLITADVAHGYVFKSWEKLNEGCDVDDLEKMKVRVTAGQTRCKLRAVYDEDPTANIGLGLVNVYYSNKLNCMYLSLADSNKREKYSSIIPLQVSFTSVSDFVFVIDQDTIHLHSVGDTIKLPIANKSYRDYNKIDTMVVVVPEPSDPYNRGVFTCIDLPDGIMNGDEHFYGLYTNYGGRPYSYEISTREPLYHDPDALDTITIATVTSATEFSDKPVVRATKNVAIEVRTQDFSDDTWDIDYLLIDIPANILEWLDVAVSCTASGDREIVKVNHVEGGVYRSASVLKNEGKATKGDGVLTCAAYDRIVTEFVDPFYKTVTRDTVAFEDVVPLDYQFLNEDLYRDIDSVEATEVNFAFRLNRVSPTLDKADTIMVVLFTDAGDSVWVSAVETDVYSSEFEGFGSFRFVTRKEDARDDQLDAAMDLAADLNRVVIRMQVENDGSALDSRDSLVVFYQFIPADSAEIHDKDRDGRADFIRVHFAKSISNEILKIDSLFWGPKDASGKNATASGKNANASGRGAARSIAAENLVVSADGKWIEAALEEPFEYGVTSAAGQGYLRISRKTSSTSQKVMLTDKVGAVPVSAVKRPGRLTDDEFLNGKTELPLDTLVVTMSEPLDTMSRLQCRNLMKSASGADKSCEPQEMFFYAGKGLGARTVYKERYSRDKSGRVWTIVLPRNVNVRVGDVISSNWRAYIEDAAGNAMGDGGVVVTGEDSDLYIYSIKAFPEVVGSDKAPRWFNPEKGESERMKGASIRVETRMAYDAAVSVFDNMGHVVSQFKHSFGKHGEKEDDAYVSDENATFVSFIRWDTKTLEKRLVGTGVYIWKINFKFEDGHTEWRTIKSGIRR